MAGYDICFINRAGTIDCVNSVDEGMTLLDTDDDGYLWFDFYAPTKDSLSILGLEPFGIHDRSLEDCMDDDQIPKINEYSTYAQVLFNTFVFCDNAVKISEVNLFTGKNFFVSVTTEGIGKPGYVSEFRTLIESEIRNAKLGPSYALHIILDHIVDEKFSAIDAVGDNLAKLETIMTENHNAFDQGLLQGTRQSLLSMRKSLFHEREILVKICRNDITIIPDKAIIHYNDIYDHITKFFELTEIYREMVTNLIQTNLAMINNDIAMAANATNISVKRLTLITTIFMPLTLLSGICGMSEWSMMTGPEHWKIAYPGFLGIMFVMALVSYRILKYIERNDYK